MTLNENEEVPKEQISGLVDCPHVTISFQRNKITECIKRSNSFHFDKCEECDLNQKFVEITSEYVYDFSCWLCLSCGKNLCGRNMNKHAILHYERELESNNNTHALSLNVSVGGVWCYICDAYIDITNLSEIQRIINVLENHKTKSSSDSSTLLLHSNLNHFADLPDLYPIRGLTNLGNTCYMNSVLQCLSKTPYLRKVLEDLKETSYEFQINLNKLKPMKNFDQKTMIKGTLSTFRHEVTSQLLETINELNYCRSGSRNCYDPHCLLRSIANIVHQFSGYQQHDSHELMRHLLEIVRTDDIERAKSAIARCLKSAETFIDPKQIKGIAQQLLSQLITTETVFKGFLVSTLQCEQCKHKTQREECFLDLSLPIYTYSMNKMDDNYNQSSGGIYNNYYHSNSHAGHSQTQHFYHQQQSQSSQGLSNHNSNIIADSSGKKSKKRSKKSEKKRNKENRNRTTLGSSSSRIELDKTNIKIVPDENKIDKKLCIEVGDDVSGTAQLGEEYMVGVDVSMNDNEAENCLHDEINTNEEELDEDDDDDEEKSSSTNTDLCMEINSTSDDLNLNIQDKNSQDSYNANNDAMEVEFLDDTQRKCPILFENDQQCSVTTCLFRFTEAEVMGGNNKVGCEKCTKNNGKLIYQKTKKQLLISKPPPVLILHLKRFEAHMGSYRKTVKAVNFSTILDLTPFCWKDCRTTTDGNQYLYSLYGIVEHSGTLRSGHYVAYVKVRPFYENLDFIQPLLTKSKSIGDLTAELLTSNMLSSSLPSSNNPNLNHTYNADNSSSSWFRISDASYTRVSEKEVLAAQAYLLFYERIAYEICRHGCLNHCPRNENNPIESQHPILTKDFFPQSLPTQPPINPILDFYKKIDNRNDVIKTDFLSPKNQKEFPYGPRSLESTTNTLVASPRKLRKKRTISVENVDQGPADVGLSGLYEVISEVDLAFNPLDTSRSEPVTVFQGSIKEEIVYGSLCLSLSGFSIIFVFVATSAVISAFVAGSFLYRYQVLRENQQIMSTSEPYFRFLPLNSLTNFISLRPRQNLNDCNSDNKQPSN